MNELSNLLLDAILLLLNSNSSISKSRVLTLVQCVEESKPKQKRRGGRDGMTLEEVPGAFSDAALENSLAKIARELCELSDSTSKTEQAELLIRFATDKELAKHPDILEAIKAIFSGDTPFTTAKIEKLQDKIKHGIALHKYRRFLSQGYSALSKASDATDIDLQGEYIDSITNLAKDLLDKDKEILSQGDQTIIERIDVSCYEDVQKGAERFLLSEAKNILKTPLQGLNMMLGKHRGGFALGEAGVLYGLPGMNKSGLLKLLACHMPLINAPSPDLGPGIPAMLYLTFENDANKDMMWWYEHIYAVQNGVAVDKRTYNPFTIAQVMTDLYKGSGYRLIIERRSGLDFGSEEYARLLEEYEAMGYRIVITFNDYKRMMKHSSSYNTSNKLNNQLQVTFNETININKLKNITDLTVHQLSRAASDIAHSGKQNVVKYFGENVIADSIDVEREVDFSAFIHLEYDMHGRRYLTVKRGKHRYVNDTPVAHQYFAYMFDPALGILPDFGKEPTFTRDIYAVPGPDGEVTPKTPRKSKGGIKSSSRDEEEDSFADVFSA